MLGIRTWTYEFEGDPIEPITSPLFKKCFLFTDLRERETVICCSAYLCIHWLILVCAVTRDWITTLAYWDDTLTSWATWPGLNKLLFMGSWLHSTRPSLPPAADQTRRAGQAGLSGVERLSGVKGRAPSWKDRPGAAGVELVSLWNPGDWRLVRWAGPWRP